MYFLPRLPFIRLMAFEDTIDSQNALNIWLSTFSDWASLSDSTDVLSHQVRGASVLGASLNPDGSFVTDGTGIAQIDFQNNPESLLFIYSNYTYASSSSTFSYENIAPHYFRWEASALSFNATPLPLTQVWDAIGRLEANSAKKVDIDTIKGQIGAYESQIQRLVSRNDPFTVMMPTISAINQLLQQKIADLQSQIDQLQLSPGTELAVTSYYTKSEVDSITSQKANSADLTTLTASFASETELQTHEALENPHGTTFLDVGSPSNPQFSTLTGRVTNLENTDFVHQISGTGGITASETTSGNWTLDSSQLRTDISEEIWKEIPFSIDGTLNAQPGYLFWTPWVDVVVTNIRFTLGTAPVGAPVVVDILKNNTSLYGGVMANMPTIAQNTKSLVVTPSTPFSFGGGSDQLSIDIKSVGLQNRGSDLLVQVQYIPATLYAGL